MITINVWALYGIAFVFYTIGSGWPITLLGWLRRKLADRPGKIRTYYHDLAKGVREVSVPASYRVRLLANALVMLVHSFNHLHAASISRNPEQKNMDILDQLYMNNVSAICNLARDMRRLTDELE